MSGPPVAVTLQAWQSPGPGTQGRGIDFDVCLPSRTPHGMIIKFSVNVGCDIRERKVRVVSPKEMSLASGRAPNWKSYFWKVQFTSALPLASVTLRAAFRH